MSQDEWVVYLENNNPDASAESDDIIYRDLAEVALDHAGPDQMPPLHSH